MPGQPRSEIGALGRLRRRLLIPVLPHVPHAQLAQQPHIRRGEGLRHRHERHLPRIPPRRHAGAFDPRPHDLQPLPQFLAPLLHIRHAHIITWGAPHELAGAGWADIGLAPRTQASPEAPLALPPPPWRCRRKLRWIAPWRVAADGAVAGRGGLADGVLPRRRPGCRCPPRPSLACPARDHFKKSGTSSSSSSSKTTPRRRVVAASNMRAAAPGSARGRAGTAAVAAGTGSAA